MSHPLGVRIPGPPAAPIPVRWECANRHCTSWAVTYDGKLPYHPCRELSGAFIPLVRAGVRAEHRTIERPDDVGADLVREVTDRRGRLIMAVETHRADGYDTTVYAPTARADREDTEQAKERAPDG
jgi:hypothetical protein